MRRLHPLLSSGLLALALATCTTPGERRFTSRAADRAVMAASRVEPANLRADVEGVLDARRRETPIPSQWSAQMPLTHLESAEYMARRFAAVGVPAVIDR